MRCKVLKELYSCTVCVQHTIHVVLNIAMPRSSNTKLNWFFQCCFPKQSNIHGRFIVCAKESIQLTCLQSISLLSHQRVRSDDSAEHKLGQGPLRFHLLINAITISGRCHNVAVVDNNCGNRQPTTGSIELLFAIITSLTDR